MTTDETTNLVLEHLRHIRTRVDAMDERLDRIHDEQRSMRNEIGRLNQNQMDTARSIMDTIRAINSLRTDLELLIRTEIGGLFAHLETRLEQRIDERMKPQ